MARTRRSRKQSTPSGGSKRSRPSLDLAIEDDEHISSDEEEEQERGPPSLGDEEDEQEEPIESKRLRLAKEYLEKIDAASESSDASSSSGDEDEDGDGISRKLQRDRLKKQGMLERHVAEKVQQYSTQAQVKLLKGHDLTPTCVALSRDDKFVSGAKDHSVILWDVETHTKLGFLCKEWKKDKVLPRTLGQVLSLACSDDGRYTAVGRRDASVQIYDLRTNELVKTFTNHKGAVNCLAFQSNSLQLFSGGDDRLIQHYNLEQMLHLETLYGHQFAVSSIDCHRQERPVSVGMDRTARAWKLAEDSHLIFRNGSKIQAADCVNVIKDDWFLTGHRDGYLSVWTADKKRPVATVENAHGVVGGVGRGISSLSSLKMSDLVATGSNDGYLRLWKVQTGRTLEERGIDPLCDIPLPGYINSIAMGPKAKFCILAVGQEPRLGRWDRVRGAKNRIAVVQLRNVSAEEDDDDESGGNDEGSNEESSSSEEDDSDSGNDSD